MTRLILGCLVALIVAACGGSPPASTGPVRTAGLAGQGSSPAQQASQPAPVSTPAPVGTAAPGGATGSAESIVRALVPPGAVEVTHASVGNQFSMSVTSQLSLAELEAFWDQKLPTTGVTQTGKLNQAGSLVYAFTNPDGGITAVDDGSGGFQIAISAGIS